MRKPRRDPGRQSSARELIRGNVAGLAALFFALSGGMAFATHPGGENTISSADIVNEEVENKDLAPNAVGSGKIADRQVKNADLSIGASSSNTIADGGIQGVDVKDATLTGAKLADAAVTIPKLAFDPATQAELNAHKNSDDHDDRYWTLEGNEDTAAGKQFLGTIDDEPLELWVNAARALRLEPASDGANQSPNVIGGIADNSVTAGVHSATIGGGGRLDPADPATANVVADDGGTIGGGANNQAGNEDGVDQKNATVGGGRGNTASGTESVVGGGRNNVADASFSTVGGGASNLADATHATVAGGGQNVAGQLGAVGGGNDNTASGVQSTIPGGDQNVAAGALSFAAGQRAEAEHDGAFVWADSSGTFGIESEAENQFIARASGGFFLEDDSSTFSLDDQGGFINTSTGAFLSDAGVWTNNSDERLKQGFADVNSGQVLDKIAELPVRTWSYEAEPDVRHIGPTAQDFHRAFGLGEDNRHIGSVDADGVALAAIKGLHRRLRAERRLRQKQGRRIARLEARLTALERNGG